LGPWAVVVVLKSHVYEKKAGGRIIGVCWGGQEGALAPPPGRPK